jgi:ABC-type phosphate/phosphonate transport system substrate-binding protein
MSSTTTPDKQPTRFISCGMYAFTGELRTAWQKLFDDYSIKTESLAFDTKLRFESSEDIYRDPQLFIGHTCGYPLMNSLRDDLTPVCVPVFDVSGCDNKMYSSAFIVNANSDIETLEDCYRGVAALNDFDSNSGMNLLRHAIAPLSQGKPYFSAVHESGSHFQSFIDVAGHRADVAAIDCVSYQLIADHWPDMAAGVRNIGFSEKTYGLPFVMPKRLLGSVDKQDITAGLNRALSNLPRNLHSRLHLRGFEPVDIEDYEKIVELETFAQRLGYPVLK